MVILSQKDSIIAKLTEEHDEIKKENAQMKQEQDEMKKALSDMRSLVEELQKRQACSMFYSLLCSCYNI